MNNDTFDITKPYCFRKDKDKKPEEREEIVIYCTDAPGIFSIHGRRSQGIVISWTKFGSEYTDVTSDYDLVNYEPKSVTEELDPSKLTTGQVILVRAREDLPWIKSMFLAYYKKGYWCLSYGEQFMERWRYAKLAPSPEPKEEVIERWMNIYLHGPDIHRTGSFQKTLDKAIYIASQRDDFFARVKIPFRKGDGLSSEEKARLK